MLRPLLVLLCSVLFLSGANGLIHQLTIDKDDRKLFKIETFGFNRGGVMELSISAIDLAHPSEETIEDKNAAVEIGFLMRKSESEAAAQEDLENIIESGHCLFNTLEGSDVVINLGQDNMWKSKSHIVHIINSEAETGLYTLYFARCTPVETGHSVSFTLEAQFKNVGHSLPGKSTGQTWDYLSAGDQPLPIMYTVFFILFFLALLTWASVLRRDPSEHGTIHKIHHLMTMLLVLKCCTLLTESIRYHMVSATGVNNFMSTVYYIFTTLRGIMLFLVILLIGSGWSIVRGFLHNREKKIIVVVLFAQVINNIAMIVMEETAPGSVSWLEWRDALHIFDLVCCVSILFPVIWSIKHLTAATQDNSKDHKSQLSLIKLQLFRSFYVMVVSYIYFTRIIVYLVEATVPFHQIWLGAFATEFATLSFYVATGFKFQPQVDNPYLAVAAADDETSPADQMDREFGEVDSDEEKHVELSVVRKNTAIGL